MAWLYLCIAGVMEVVWSTCMKFSNGFTDLKFSILTIVGMIISFAFLSQATKVLPLGDRLRHLDRHRGAGGADRRDHPV